MVLLKFSVKELGEEKSREGCAPGDGTLLQRRPPAALNLIPPPEFCMWLFEHRHSFCKPEVCMAILPEMQSPKQQCQASESSARTKHFYDIYFNKNRRFYGCHQ